MKIGYSNGNSFGKGYMMGSVYQPGFSDPKHRELEMQYRSEYDPERPPKPERGDTYIFVGLIVGLIIGGGLGFLGGPIGIIGGAIAGAIIGVIIGGLVKKHRRSRR